MSRRAIIGSLIVALFIASASVLVAEQGRRGGPPPPHPSVALRGQVFVGGYFYDPIFGPYPWWPGHRYPYFYFPRYEPYAHVRLRITPDTAAVYVDGFYAGAVDDFDGVFDGLTLTPGGHTVAIFLDGYRTTRHNIHVAPGQSFSIRETLERLAPGIQSEPPVLAPPLPAPPPGTYRLPATPPPQVSGNETTLLPGRAAGIFDLRVQPATATVTIDGEAWASSDGARYVVHLAVGTHRIEVTELGYQRFVGDVVIRDGDTTHLNVTLVPGTR
jgi:hypothetical protein